MKQFPPDIKFKYSWRNYQDRVLKELKAHLDDNHLHIIAPPGSGKTILGLEVALRLNRPTLIFAPSIAIRNQWIQRFCELFLQVRQIPDWISRDIKNPKFLTVATYQALHAACTGIDLDEDQNEPEEEENGANGNGFNHIDAKDVIQRLRKQGVGTIVVDEAHHLKNTWWKALTEVKEDINPTIVGLTATPPYDVSPLEWERYTRLNGPVDAEISVPELVVEGDLCPHQDYVYLSYPTVDENRKINSHRERMKSLFDEVKADTTLCEALLQHPIYHSPQQQLEWIYTNLEYYSATLIYLNSAGQEISEKHLEIIGDRSFKLPKLNYEWIEILLTFYLFKDPDSFEAYTDHQENLLNILRRNGAIERRRIRFDQNRRINSFLSSSISKLQSIDEIVDIEHDNLNKDLRMVVLTDYIRKEFLVKDSVNDLELNKVGVLPIFEQLRRTNDRNIKIGVLTGSLIILPRSAENAFHDTCRQFHIEKVSTSPLPFDDAYLIVNSNERLKNAVVQIVTHVFQEGSIEVLIGTKSLLGEGWDAPSINSLILASFVGSYVLSNQMRGRAIRTDRLNKDKTGNIWHLVCVDPTSKTGGEDIQLLSRRFRAFVGVSNKEDISIENGIDRIALPENYWSSDQINATNKTTLKLAGQRDRLKEKWRIALENGVSLIEEIKVPFPEDQDYKGRKSMYYNRTVAYLLASLGSMMLAFLQSVLEGFGRVARHIETTEDLFRWLIIVGVAGLLVFGGMAFRTLRIYVKYRDISKDIHQIAEALLSSLIKEGTITTEYSKLTIESSVDDFGGIYCHLKGGTTYEKSTFIKSLEEIVSVVKNPRYLIIRKSLFLNIISQKDYHSVPEILGRNKRSGEYFKQQWKRFVGACELVYTRTIEGRKMLLKSRMHSLASEFEEKTDRVNKWR